MPCFRFSISHVTNYFGLSSSSTFTDRSDLGIRTDSFQFPEFSLVLTCMSIFIGDFAHLSSRSLFLQMESFENVLGLQVICSSGRNLNCYLFNLVHARAHNRCRTQLLPADWLEHLVVLGMYRFTRVCVYFSEPTWTECGLQWLELFTLLSWDKLLTEHRITDTTFKPCLKCGNICAALDHFLNYMTEWSFTASFIENSIILLPDGTKHWSFACPPFFTWLYNSDFL